MSRAPSRRPKVVVLARPREQRALVEGALEALGASVIDLPAIEIVPPEDPGPLDEALRELEAYEWVGFTSANAVRAVASRLAALDLPPGAGQAGAQARRGRARRRPRRCRPLSRARRLLCARASPRGRPGSSRPSRRSGSRGRGSSCPCSSRGRDDLPQGLAVAGSHGGLRGGLSDLGPPRAGRGFARMPGEATPTCSSSLRPRRWRALASAAGGRLRGQAGRRHRAHHRGGGPAGRPDASGRRQGPVRADGPARGGARRLSA